MVSETFQLSFSGIVTSTYHIPAGASPIFSATYHATEIVDSTGFKVTGIDYFPADPADSYAYVDGLNSAGAQLQLTGNYENGSVFGEFNNGGDGTTIISLGFGDGKLTGDFFYSILYSGCFDDQGQTACYEYFGFEQTFAGRYTGTDTRQFYDSDNNSYFSITSTPEPATWAMMLLGFVGLGFVGYRRNRVARTVRPPQNRDRGAALVCRQFAFLSLTPAPPPFSAMNSTPAVSKIEPSVGDNAP